jgi:lipid-A-disaccharide synthase-like uncharacterized protein
MNTTMLAVGQTAAERGQWWPDSWVGRFWILFGFSAQLIFSLRFLYQWIASERRGSSYVPVAFWYLSLVGGIMLLIYAVFWKHDLVVAIGQSTGSFIYIRNLMLVKKEKKGNSC